MTWSVVIVGMRAIGGDRPGGRGKMKHFSIHDGKAANATLSD